MPANPDELQKGAQRLAGVLLGDVERMADRSAQRMQKLLPAYTRVPRRELVPVVLANTRNLLEAIHDPTINRPGEQVDHRASGETRARQGITLDEMLHGWRIGLEVVREEAVATAEELDFGDDALLEFVVAVLRWGDVGMRVSTAAHREAEVRELTRLAEEQAALRRVATLVAQGAPSGELFAAVAEQVACVLAVPVVQIVRYEPDGAATLLATFGECRGAGPPSTLPSPIVVSGQEWGATVVCSPATEPLPSDTESRLTAFNELVSAAIASAYARETLQRPAAEQAALRRVATLVARGARPDEVFSTVADEVAGLLPVTSAALGRFDPDGMVTTVAAWSAGGIAFPVTRRWDPKGNNVTGIVLATGRSARVDDFTDASGPIGIHARDAGYRSAVGSPITVEGRLWGVMSAASSLAEPLPADTEARLASFTELVATAIANTESRSGLTRLAGEQAALRRVATLVARAAPSEEVFVKVCEEVGPLLGAEAGLIDRFDADGYCTTVGSWGKLREAFEVGSRWKVEGSGGASAQVYRTGRPVRLRYAGPGSIAGEARRVGLHAAVGSPIVVNGRLWASLVVATPEARPLPDDAESRIAQFAELVATSVANVQARSDLEASRARIISAADEERRRVVRDLREGAQKHLAQTILSAEQAQDRLRPTRPDAPDLVREALRNAQAATDELRELAHSILPSALTHAGLEAGVRTLASRLAIPVEVDVSMERLPREVEATAYFVVSEALTNVAKHSDAQAAKVSARLEHRALQVSVCADGVGGAPIQGTGSVALRDRLAVLGGSLHVGREPHGATLIAACIPVRWTDSLSS